MGSLPPSVLVTAEPRDRGSCEARPTSSLGPWPPCGPRRGRTRHALSRGSWAGGVTSECSAGAGRDRTQEPTAM